MDNLLLAALMLFFGQGVFSRNDPPARFIAAVFVAALAALFIRSLGV